MQVVKRGLSLRLDRAPISAFVLHPDQRPHELLKSQQADNYHGSRAEGMCVVRSAQGTTDPTIGQRYERRAIHLGAQFKLPVRSDDTGSSKEKKQEA